MSVVKTRFAPSPTGKLHIGSVRTALYAYLFARRCNGKFLLRIEDTDLQRSSMEYNEDIIKSLKWLGIDYDEGPYFQSERLDTYRAHIDRLLSSDKAYESEGAVYFRVQENETIDFPDLIRGRIIFNSREIDDFVILKKDGYPTFHFAVVVDDATMNITHVVRGEDHISNTPKQILLYKALGFSVPIYAHLPLIVGADHAPLSKRHASTAISEYINKDYLPDAVINFLARLGWGYKDQEVFTKDELIALFDISKVSRSPAVFDILKLDWLNSQHLKRISPEEIYSLIKDRITYEYMDILPIILLSQPKASSLQDIIETIKYCRDEDYPFDHEIRQALLASEDQNKLLKEVSEELTKVPDSDWTANNIENVIRNFASKKGIKAAQVIHPLRAALTGRKVTPGIFELIEVLGQKRTLARLQTRRWSK